jgi:hypothetical protein
VCLHAIGLAADGLVGMQCVLSQTAPAGSIGWLSGMQQSVICLQCRDESVSCRATVVCPVVVIAALPGMRMPTMTVGQQACLTSCQCIYSMSVNPC